MEADNGNMDILCTFVMAAYNSAKYIRPAIESVLKQTEKKWELIVVDDGSCDETAGIVGEYAAADSRVILIKNEHIGNAGEVRNIAIDRAKGRYIQSVDSDDFIKEDYLEKCMETIMRKKCDIVIPVCLKLEDDGTIITQWYPIDHDYERVLSNIEGFYYSLDWKIHGVFFVKSRLIKEIRYDSGMLNSDEFTCRKLLYNSTSIAFSDTIYYYRNNISSTTLSIANKAKMFGCILTCRRIYDYSVDNKMPSYCMKKSAKILVRSLWRYQRNYIANTRCFDQAERNSIEHILKEIYDGINLKIIWQSQSTRGLFILFSFGSYELYRKYAGIRNNHLGENEI